MVPIVDFIISSDYLLIPKSEILIKKLPSLCFAMRIFSGFKSRWQIFPLWRKFSPLAIAIQKERATSGENLNENLSKRFNKSPS